MASSAVNRPTNTKVKEQDVNQKLQLYGIYSGKFNDSMATRPFKCATVRCKCRRAMTNVLLMQRLRWAKFHR